MKIARAFVNNADYTWSAFDDIGGVPIAVKLIAVDSQDNFECLSVMGSVCKQYIQTAKNIKCMLCPSLSLGDFFCLALEPQSCNLEVKL